MFASEISPGQCTAPNGAASMVMKGEGIQHLGGLLWKWGTDIFLEELSIKNITKLLQEKQLW